MATTEQAIEQLIKTMNATTGVNVEVKAAAAEGLGYVGGPIARAALINVITATVGVNVEVKAAAAKALGRATAS